MAKKILIIDNDIESFDDVITKLEESGYNVIHAKDGMAGIHFVHNENPELIILTYLLPHNMNGCECCSLIKRDIRFHEIPIIMISVCSLKDVKNSIVEPPDCFIQKPCKYEDILIKIKELINQSELKKEELSKKLNDQDAQWAERILNSRI
jgi:two-component system, OmpR family, alkaline phosphatase synthesis response regulator PhoP